MQVTAHGLDHAQGVRSGPLDLAFSVEQGSERRWTSLGLGFEAQEGGLLSVSRKGNEIALLRRGLASAGDAR